MMRKIGWKTMVLSRKVHNSRKPTTHRVVISGVNKRLIVSRRTRVPEVPGVPMVPGFGSRFGRLPYSQPLPAHRSNSSYKNGLNSSLLEVSHHLVRRRSSDGNEEAAGCLGIEYEVLKVGR